MGQRIGLVLVRFAIFALIFAASFALDEHWPGHGLMIGGGAAILWLGGMERLFNDMLVATRSLLTGGIANDNDP